MYCNGCSPRRLVFSDKPASFCFRDWWSVHPATHSDELAASPRLKLIQSKDALSKPPEPCSISGACVVRVHVAESAFTKHSSTLQKLTIDLFLYRVGAPDVSATRQRSLALFRQIV